MAKNYAFTKEKLIIFLHNYSVYQKQKTGQWRSEGKDLRLINNSHILEWADEYIKETERTNVVRMEDILDKVEKAIEETLGKSMEELVAEINKEQQ